MATVEVSAGPRFSIRLAKAVLLLAAGAAAHMVLFPASPAIKAPGRPLDVETATPVGTAGTSTVQASVGSGIANFAATEARAARAVKVIVTTIRPAIFRAPEPDNVAPARLVNANLVTPALSTPPPPVVSDSGVVAPQVVPPQHEARPGDTSPSPRSESRDTSEIQLARTASHKLPDAVLASEAVAPSTPPPMAAAARVERMRSVPDGVSHPDPLADERLVGAVLQQYRAAYERLDVSAAQTVWPTVDARALSAAFRQLAGQRVTFESCGVSVSGSGSQATARCQGQAEFMPKVGARRAYVASGEWVFDLAKQDAAWRIVNAEATIK